MPDDCAAFVGRGEGPSRAPERKPRPRGRGEWGRVRLTVTPCRISPDGAVPWGTRQRLSAEPSTCPNGCNEKRRIAEAPRGGEGASRHGLNGCGSENARLCRPLPATLACAKKKSPDREAGASGGRVRLTVTPCRISPVSAVPWGTRQRLLAERSTCPNVARIAATKSGASCKRCGPGKGASCHGFQRMRQRERIRP